MVNPRSSRKTVIIVVASSVITSALWLAYNHFFPTYTNELPGNPSASFLTIYSYKNNVNSLVVQELDGDLGKPRKELLRFPIPVDGKGHFAIRILAEK